jgi:hypothetical protein
MNTNVVVTAGMVSPTEKPASKASKIVRRAHMYLGLFLAPWMVMYALSTLVMSHREFFLSFYPTKTPQMTVERELDYTRTFPADATPDQIGAQILEDIGLSGTHRVSGGKDGKPLVIDRQHSLAQRRISYDPAARRITVQREEFRGLTFLERMHRRRGYQQPYALEDGWAFSVDLTVTLMVFWSLSGLWLWWEIRQTRLSGALCLGFGLVLFALFMAMI